MKIGDRVSWEDEIRPDRPDTMTLYGTVVELADQGYAIVRVDGLHAFSANIPIARDKLTMHAWRDAPPVHL